MQINTEKVFTQSQLDEILRDFAPGDKIKLQIFRDGKTKKGPCSICGALKTEGHHPDYSKPMEVLWLCGQHNKEEHKRLKAIERAHSN